ncbi:hypothetical protein ACFSX9_00440 [Flavobacterium ardleyense]|uniref:HNH endonuclease n=1 Tax=Flavobacterium ardleyense TaxID=2038737 RepID=A0ABW5Z4W5_9FLAO
MIKIDNNALADIIIEYGKEINSKLTSKINSILDVIAILESPLLLEKKIVKGKVRAYSSALKVIKNRDKLLDSKHGKGSGKETMDLIYTLEKYKIKADKRSKCRKTMLFRDYEDISNKLLNFINNNDLIIGTPEQLLILNDQLDKEIKFTNVRIYNYFFNYKNFYDEIDLKIGHKLDLKCCPYCNRNFITHVSDKNNRVIGPTYDHFFSKSRYKYLSLSFYNLIPSCFICNSNLKGNIDFTLDTHIHPYLGGFEKDAFFDFELSTNNYNGKKEIIFSPFLVPNMNLSFKKNDRIFGDKNKKNSGSINVFKLQEVYKLHDDSVEEIYAKFDKSSPHYIGSISEIITQLKTSEEEFYRYHFRNYFDSKDFNKRPLAKLDKDIYDKFLLISQS